MSLLSVGAATTALASCDEKTTDKPQSSAPRLRLQASWINDAEFTGYFVALDDQFRFYEKLGIDVEYIPGGPQVIPETSLLNERADIALTTPETTAQYIVRDRIPFVIIGAQYQKNPIGIVSIATNPVRAPRDLIGRKLAVAPVNKLTVDAMLRLNGIDSSRVDLVPYTYDPDILVSGRVDATVDFVTNIPYAIKRRNREPVSFLLYDAGFRTFNDTVVVHRDTIEDQFDALAAFLAASMLGWEENYKNRNYEVYVARYMNSWFKGNGRTEANEVEFTQNQKPLMEHSSGFFSMTPDGIEANVQSLRALDLNLTPDVFDTRVLGRAWELRSDVLKRSANTFKKDE